MLLSQAVVDLSYSQPVGAIPGREVEVHAHLWIFEFGQEPWDDERLNKDDADDDLDFNMELPARDNLGSLRVPLLIQNNNKKKKVFKNRYKE